MSDSKLRELDRPWRDAGTGEDEAAYTSERVRVGRLLWLHMAAREART